jgi:exosortase
MSMKNTSLALKAEKSSARPTPGDQAATLPIQGEAFTAKKSSVGVALGVSALAVTFLWAYWSTIGELVTTWNNEPDYSHGFLVPALAGFFLWTARERFPGFQFQFAWPGLLLVLLSLTLRLTAGFYYIPQIDGWSIPLWIAGVVWTFGGWSLARWAMPAMLFLYFMVPLPFRVERMLSLPLQTTATSLSVWALQCLGQPAIDEGHTIHLGTHRLEVEQACSGLRMLVGILALAVAYLLIFPKTWWERALLLASVVPVAMAANTIRIVATGLLYQYVSGDAGKKFTHDFAGWTMIVIAATLFGGVLWYLKKLLPEHETMQLGELLRARD